MKINQLRTAWVLATLMWYTAIDSTRCIFKYFFSTISRDWTDKVLHHWVDQLLNEVQVEYKVINPFNVQPQPGVATIIMCNHSSAYDIPLAFKAFPKHSIRMLSKKELAKIPLMGKAMAAAEFPFIDRKNKYQAIKDLAYAQKLMESGIVMWIAPEGTRSKDGKLGSFKKGGFITAIQSKATIIPIGIRGANSILPARTFNLHLKQKAEIHIGKPIDASQFSIDNKEQLIRHTYEVIKELVGENPSA
ncbi:1-acyl-sn-glycerol-3-phosphate acyltransferase [Fluoribacter dumoffii]|uniref:1-acyl-sn-glycerol-3-phosphate acyltransferase n=1 Tax=Fluoribacter dumoffii TaxID=463 RepID=A0A377G661_9GAMM|nr:lysophospholipid acyltransferase family protein [Fluoribacter dumoffii]KTC92471.1 1-acyl-sn-glycerol-3-phosphate acetyltransferase [Fluoribacter dumoffii NY 23]MCW8387047.1 1-acyl-sn-glycerol-3-phosphate acyltransferase [Fluoribacter dumoffii]MCW8417449.1 1-acyl-sn-glycerol-3-phosphate acyltransferase [Fluoribacter dumoffii]MCW8454709.1 1-acyl-sn-glycerol-3-phosphate acyltransferase [Fluoribacter dumoffii]MCW8461213.1 1-acyl-sn-glycerol-3-phosphate acyltransferase [Fluoribacter dumoffii]